MELGKLSSNCLTSLQTKNQMLGDFFQENIMKKHPESIIESTDQQELSFLPDVGNFFKKI